MQICSLLHEHVDNHSCTRFLKGNVDNKPLTNPHEVNVEGQFWGLEKVHSHGLNHNEDYRYLINQLWNSKVIGSRYAVALKTKNLNSKNI